MASYEAGATTQTLLQNAVQMIQELSGAVQTLLAGLKSGHSAAMLPLPTYSGYVDLLTARDYLDSLSRYQRTMGLDDQVVLKRVVPAALTDTAVRWYRLTSCGAARELELGTQAPDESLQEYARAMGELIFIAEPRASNEERVEQAILQAHPTFSACLRGGRFRDLEELAAVIGAFRRRIESRCGGTDGARTDEPNLFLTSGFWRGRAGTSAE